MALSRDFIPNKQVRRIFTIIRILIKRRTSASLEDVADALAASDIPIPSMRTLDRDMKEIESLGYSISLGSGRYLLQNREEIAGKHFADDEVQALQMGRSMFRYFDGTHLKRSIDTAIDMVTGATRSDITNEWLDELEDNFMVHLGPHRCLSDKSDAIDDIVYAINGRFVLNMEYQKPNSMQETVVIAPYRLVMYRDTLYLLAHKYGTSDMLRIYHVSRICGVTIQDVTFERSRLLLDQYEENLSHSVGISASGTLTDVEICFDKRVLNALKERVWHQSQEIVEGKDSVILKLRVFDNNELIAWILGWGNVVKSIQPKSLATYVEAQKR